MSNKNIGNKCWYCSLCRSSTLSPLAMDLLVDSSPTDSLEPSTLQLDTQWLETVMLTSQQELHPRSVSFKIDNVIHLLWFLSWSFKNFDWEIILVQWELVLASASLVVASTSAIVLFAVHKHLTIVLFAVHKYLTIVLISAGHIWGSRHCWPTNQWIHTRHCSRNVRLDTGHHWPEGKLFIHNKGIHIHPTSRCQWSVSFPIPGHGWGCSQPGHWKLARSCYCRTLNSFCTVVQVCLSHLVESWPLWQSGHAIYYEAFTATFWVSRRGASWSWLSMQTSELCHSILPDRHLLSPHFSVDRGE